MRWFLRSGRLIVCMYFFCCKQGSEVLEGSLNYEIEEVQVVAVWFEIMHRVSEHKDWREQNGLVGITHALVRTPY